jgi:putative membrane protein
MAETAEPGSAQRVDSRLLHANERTLLAWLRTGLALVAFGFLLERVDSWLSTAPADGAVAGSVGTAWIGVGFVALGSLANGLAILRFVHTRRALRMGADLPTDVFPIAIAAIVTLLGAALTVYLLAKLV